MTGQLADKVNRFAGAHSITADPLELKAADRAGDTSLRLFPYYLERYGERARLFGRSDGGWLAMLCGGDASAVEDEVLWLGRVLSSRGMPRWLLERHLEILHRALADLPPSQAHRYEPLAAAAARLAELRLARVPLKATEELAAAFGASAEAEWRERIPEMGILLVSAVADEADGIERAVESVEEWAADPSRFPAAWTDAVRATISAARGRVRPRAAAEADG